MNIYQIGLADLPEGLRLNRAESEQEKAYQSFLEEPGQDRLHHLRAQLSDPLLSLLEAAAYVLDLTPQPPSPRLDKHEGEIFAFLALVRSGYLLNCGRPEVAIEMLTQALNQARSCSPVLAGRLAVMLADITSDRQYFQEALRLLEESDLYDLRADLWLDLANLYQQESQGRKGMLGEAVKAYQTGLMLIDKDQRPLAYAQGQSGLALAYLTMPMTEASDALRLGIAVTALREALTVYRPDQHPELWASTQMNLANALQYLPSTHPEQNLQESVRLYEEIAPLREHGEPLARARLLANWGNALAHLGRFTEAEPRLRQAQELFSQAGDEEAKASIEEHLQAIASAAR